MPSSKINRTVHPTQKKQGLLKARPRFSLVLEPDNMQLVPPVKNNIRTVYLKITFNNSFNYLERFSSTATVALAKTVVTAVLKYSITSPLPNAETT